MGLYTKPDLISYYKIPYVSQYTTDSCCAALILHFLRKSRSRYSIVCYVNIDSGASGPNIPPTSKLLIISHIRKENMSNHIDN